MFKLEVNFFGLINFVHSKPLKSGPKSKNQLDLLFPNIDGPSHLISGAEIDIHRPGLIFYEKDIITHAANIDGWPPARPLEPHIERRPPKYRKVRTLLNQNGVSHQGKIIKRREEIRIWWPSRAYDAAESELAIEQLTLGKSAIDFLPELNEVLTKAGMTPSGGGQWEVDPAFLANDPPQALSGRMKLTRGTLSSAPLEEVDQNGRLIDFTFEPCANRGNCGKGGFHRQTVTKSIRCDMIVEDDFCFIDFHNLETGNINNRVVLSPFQKEYVLEKALGKRFNSATAEKKVCIDIFVREPDLAWEREGEGNIELCKPSKNDLTFPFHYLFLKDFNDFSGAPVPMPTKKGGSSSPDHICYESRSFVDLPPQKSENLER